MMTVLKQTYRLHISARTILTNSRKTSFVYLLKGLRVSQRLIVSRVVRPRHLESLSPKKLRPKLFRDTAYGHYSL